MKLICLFVLILALVSPKTRAQQGDFPQIGKPCPEFCLSARHGGSSHKVCLQDFSGKHLLLYFFSPGCTASFALLPALQDLQEKFSTRLQILAIGHRVGAVEALYEKYQKKYALSFPVAFDTSLFEQFQIKGVPCLVWVDPQGLVRALTSSEEVTPANIRSFLCDQPFPFRDLSTLAEQKRVQSLKPEGSFFLNKEKLSPKPFCFSLFAPWTPQGPSMQLKVGRSDLLGGCYFEAIGIPLSLLINQVYLGTSELSPLNPHYGTFYNYPLFEDKRTFPPVGNFATGENIYSYCLMAPEALLTPPYLQEKFSEALHDLLGYTISIRDSLIAVWKLKATPGAHRRLRSKGGPLIAEGTLVGQHYHNVPVKRLIQVLWAYQQNEPPFIDETGIEGAIDLTLEAVMTDFNEVKKALEKNGLYLTLENKRMKVIVVEKILSSSGKEKSVFPAGKCANSGHSR